WGKSKEYLPVILVKIVLPAAVAIGASRGVDYIQDKEINVLNEPVRALEQEEVNLRQQSTRNVEYKKLEEKLKNDEFEIRTKIETIQKLVAARKSTHELLLSLSQATPENVWLATFVVQGPNIQIEGSAIDFNVVSEFMRRLEES